MIHTLSGRIIVVGGITNHQYKQLSVDGLVSEFMKKFESSCSVHGGSVQGRLYSVVDKNSHYLQHLQPLILVPDYPQQILSKNADFKYLPKGINEKLSEKNFSQILEIYSKSDVGFNNLEEAMEINEVSQFLASKLRTKKRNLGMQKEILLLFADENRFYTPTGFKKKIVG